MAPRAHAMLRVLTEGGGSAPRTAQGPRSLPTAQGLRSPQSRGSALSPHSQGGRPSPHSPPSHFRSKARNQLGPQVMAA